MIYVAPQPIPQKQGCSVFLGGTIDMGNSENWQHVVTKYLQAVHRQWDIYNPRRDDWDSSWKQHPDDPQFSAQVKWKLNAMEMADVIIMVFLPDSKSPISLLELGLHAKSGKLMVVCPEAFYRSGNVKIVCHKYNITVYETIEGMLKDIFNQMLCNTSQGAL